MEVSVADEAPFVYNVGVCGDHWLLNYCPHLYQVPGYTAGQRLHARGRGRRRHEQGDRDRAQPESAALRSWRNGCRATAAQAAAWPSPSRNTGWSCIGMAGGPVRAPCAEMTRRGEEGDARRPRSDRARREGESGAGQSRASRGVESSGDQSAVDTDCAGRHRERRIDELEPAQRRADTYRAASVPILVEIIPIGQVAGLGRRRSCLRICDRRGAGFIE